MNTALESMIWIKSHLPAWERRGMSRGFLNSIISPEIGGCDLDVESAISCNQELFNSSYSQPDFIQKLKEICKKYYMSYGKVPLEALQQAENELYGKIPEFKVERPHRVDLGEQRDGIKKENLKKFGYFVENRIKNKEELYNIIREKQNKSIGNTGNKKLSFSPDKIEIFIDVIERNLPINKIMDVLDLSESSIVRYLELLKNVGILKKTGCRKYDYIVNEDIVRYENGRRHKKIEIDWNW